MKQDIVLISQQTKELEQLCVSLQSIGMDISQVENPRDALAGLALHSPAFVLLDYMMKDADFFLREILNSCFCPHPYIIVAAPFLNGITHATILNEGADACVGMPIETTEVIAVMHSAFRREKRITRLKRGHLLPQIEFNGLVIDPLRRVVTYHANQINLTVKEFDIICLLADHPYVTISKRELYETVWKCNYDSSVRTLTDHIFSLRRKMRLAGDCQNCIQTVHGVGYRFAVPT